jgi:hypothetical protein
MWGGGPPQQGGFPPQGMTPDQQRMYMMQMQQMQMQQGGVGGGYPQQVRVWLSHSQLSLALCPPLSRHLSGPTNDGTPTHPLRCSHHCRRARTGSDASSFGQLITSSYAHVLGAAELCVFYERASVCVCRANCPSAALPFSSAVCSPLPLPQLILSRIWHRSGCDARCTSDEHARWWLSATGACVLFARSVPRGFAVSVISGARSA